MTTAGRLSGKALDSIVGLNTDCCDMFCIYVPIMWIYRYMPFTTVSYILWTCKYIKTILRTDGDGREVCPTRRTGLYIMITLPACTRWHRTINRTNYEWLRSLLLI